MSTEPAPASASADLGGGAGNDLKPATLALLLLLTGIGVAASFTGWEKKTGTAREPLAQVNLTPPPWFAPATELKAMGEAAEQRRAMVAKLDRKSTGLTGLVKAYQAYNTTDLKAGGNRKSEALRDAYAEYQMRAKEFYRFKGQEAFLALGQALLDDFWQGLRTRNKVVVQALSGGFIPEGLAIGLMRGAYQPAKHTAPVISAAFLLRWVSVLVDERTVDTMVAPEERLLLLRFKVGAHRTLEPERRMALGRLLRRLQPTFPTDELLAARFASERRWSLAARFYRRALKGREDDQRLRANVAYCDELAATYEKAKAPPVR